MRTLQRIFGVDQPMVVQGPLKLGVRDAPEPDIAFLTRDAIRPERGEVLLVVEVGVDSLARDLARKATLYARHGVPEYWVLDVVGRRLIVHREPDLAQARYGRIVSLSEGLTTDLLARPDAQVAVAALLPAVELGE